MRTTVKATIKGNGGAAELKIPWPAFVTRVRTCAYRFVDGKPPQKQNVDIVVARLIDGKGHEFSTKTKIPTRLKTGTESMILDLFSANADRIDIELALRRNFQLEPTRAQVEALNAASPQ